MASHLHIKLLILMPLAFLGIWLIIAHSPLRQQKLQGRQQMDSGIKQEISTLDEDQAEKSTTAGAATTVSGKFSPGWLAEQDSRKELVAEVCNRYPENKGSLDEVLSDKRLQSHLWVSDQQKIVFCMIAKVGCSSWRTLFRELGGDPEPRKPPIHDFARSRKYDFKELKFYDTSEMKHILETYTRFIVVRHPYMRLHSAYTEKFTRVWGPNGQMNPLYPKSYGAKIIKLYWENPAPINLKTGQNITLEDFVRYLGDSNIPFGQKVDPHWVPYNFYCSPCKMRYNYILKMETLNEDSGNLLGGVFNTSLRLPALNAFNHSDIAAYKNVSREYMDKLWDAYKMDFELFGYDR